ncbi:hypothetical protein ACK8P5_26440 (plasmid) [Paenibacillus sp. EC2-1]|uniref:hypothetical protein n=1 Tax=Paenibacillus sp. EC2-1 TaxID=3388665 RepID=UPI003BEEC204
MPVQIVCLVGEGGSGKSAIAKRALEYGFTQIKSLTTRAPRNAADFDTHVFVNDERFEELRSQLAAYTLFHGYKYGATFDQIRDNHIYVVDSKGVRDLSKSLGRKNFMVIKIDTSRDERLLRMIAERGAKAAYDRAEFDDVDMANFTDYDLLLTNEVPEDLDNCVKELVSHLKRLF